MLVHENGSITYRTDHDIVAKRFANITAMAESNFDETPDGDIWREIYRRLPASFVEVERIPRGQPHGDDACLKAAHALAQRAHALTPGTFCHIHTEDKIPQAQLHTPIPWDKTAPPPQVSADTTPTDEEVTWAIDRIPVHKAQGSEKVHNLTSPNHLTRTISKPCASTVCLKIFGITYSSTHTATLKTNVSSQKSEK